MKKRAVTHGGEVAGLVRQLEKGRVHLYSGEDPLAVKVLLPAVAFQTQGMGAPVFELVEGEENAPLGVFSTVGDTTFLHLKKTVCLTELLACELGAFAGAYLLVDSESVADTETCNVAGRYSKMEQTLDTGETGGEIAKKQNLFQTLTDSFAILKSWDDAFAFGRYYPDTHHMIRHGFATVVNVYHQKGKAAATATAVGLYTTYGVLENVAVERDCQGAGYGRAVVGEVLTSCRYNRVGLLCEENLAPFYKKCGFHTCGEYLLVKV